MMQDGQEAVAPLIDIVYADVALQQQQHRWTEIEALMCCLCSIGFCQYFSPQSKIYKAAAMALDGIKFSSRRLSRQTMAWQRASDQRRLDLSHRDGTPRWYGHVRDVVIAVTQEASKLSD